MPMDDMDPAGSTDESKATTETPKAPAPTVDIGAELRKGFEGLGEGIKKLVPTPEPKPETHDWDDPEKFWLFEEGTTPKEQARLLHERQTKYMKHVIKQAAKDPEFRKELLGDIAELPKRFKDYDAAFQYFDLAKGDNPEFTKSKDAIQKIMTDEGVNYKTAKRIYDAEQKTAAPAAPTAPRVPLPGKLATAPQSSVEPKAGKSVRGHGLPKVKEIIRQGIAEGKIKFER